MAKKSKKKKAKGASAAIVDWQGVPISLQTGQFWEEWFGRSSSGKSVSVDSSLQLSTVWACVRLLAETVSTLPLKLYRRMPDGSRQIARDHPLYRVLCRVPNAEMTPGRFMLMIAASIVLRGNAFVEKRFIGTRLAALIPQLPQNMKVERLESGRLQYTYNENGKERVIDEKNIMHIRGFGLDGVMGIQPVSKGRDIIGSSMSAEEAAAKVFEHGLQASGFLTSENTLNDKQREMIRASLASFISSKNAGKTMVLEGGMKYQGISMNPEAAQMLETRTFNVEEICRWFRVPPFMVGHMSKQSSWAASVEAQNLHFLTNSLRPLLDNIEQEISRCLIGEADSEEYFARFSVEGLLRADSAGRAAYYNSALNNGWMSRNEVRALEDQPPIPGGDIYTVQGAMINLETLKTPLIAQAAFNFIRELEEGLASGDKNALSKANDKVIEALKNGDPDGPAMAHALMSYPRIAYNGGTKIKKADGGQ